VKGELKGDFVGGGQPHNNMPPYLTVNVWKRTA
jgi:microcystin-dependent protein